MRIGSRKAALLAAVSALAASAALAPAHAAVDPAGYPAIVEVAAPVHHAADQADHDNAMSPKKWALLAIAAGALAGIVRLVGARRVVEVVAAGAAKTAEVAVAATAATVKAVGGAAASPLRYLSLALGFALFVLTGADFTHLDWLGGVLSGAALTAYGLYGMWKTRRALKPIVVKKPAQSLKGNRN
ncbi:MAG: hypothetical protein R3C58_07080 [Parvularculaceae bacterium]